MEISVTLRWFGGSAAYPAFAANTDNTTGDTGQYGTLSMPFQGGYLVYEPTITDA